MAIEGDLSEQKAFPENHGSPDYWTMDRVVRWLDANDFKPAIEVFKGIRMFIS